MSRKPYDMFENCTDTWHISEGNALSTGLERSDIFHNELFKAYNQYINKCT